MKSFVLISFGKICFVVISFVTMRFVCAPVDPDMHHGSGFASWIRIHILDQDSHRGSGFASCIRIQIVDPDMHRGFGFASWIRICIVDQDSYCEHFLYVQGFFNLRYRSQSRLETYELKESIQIGLNDHFQRGGGVI